MIDARLLHRSHVLPIVLVLAAAASAAPRPQEACFWQAHAPSPTGRFEASVTVIDGLLYAFGGFKNQQIQVTTRLDVYDPQSDSWSTRTDLPSGVTHVTVAVDDRTVWMAGGFIGDNPGVATDQVWMYDVDLDVWSPGPSLPKPVAGGGLVREDRDLHYFGGVEADRMTDSADHWVLDLDQPTGWVSSAPLPEPRNHLSGVEHGGLVYAVGGQTGHDVNPTDQVFVHAYDPQTNAWTRLADLPQSRSHAEPGTFVSGGRILVMGGKSEDTATTAVPDAHAYDIATDTWSLLPFLPKPLLGVGAREIGGRVYIVGGAGVTLITESAVWSRASNEVFPDWLRINSGGPGYDSPSTQDHWCSDVLWLNGKTTSNPLVPDVHDTLDDALYRDARTSPDNNPDVLAYRIPALDGPAQLRLHFAEILFGATGGPAGGPGSRVFDVRIDGETVLDDYDIAADVGSERAVVKTFDVMSAGGELRVRLQASVDRPLLSALEVVQLPDGALENYCVAVPNSTGGTASMGFAGSGSLAADNLTLLASPVPNDFGLFLYGSGPGMIPLGSGFLCVAPPFFRLPVVPASGGTLAWDLDYANPPQQAGTIVAGSTWYFQAWFRDPSTSATFGLTDGIELHFTP